MARCRSDRWKLLFTLALAACHTPPDLAQWRIASERPRPPVQRGDWQVELAAARQRRDQGDLLAARRRVLELVAEQPCEPAVLLLASLCEADVIAWGSDLPRERRDQALASALDYARRAAAEAPAALETQSQLAWCMGAATHLQPMLQRAAHAQETLARVDQVLAGNPDDTVALMTLATLRLRLATLPFMARVFASDAPPGSLPEAVEVARRCVELVPSREHRLLLARCLHAAGDHDEARALLREARAQFPLGPRDPGLQPVVERLLYEWAAAGSTGGSPGMGY